MSRLRPVLNRERTGVGLVALLFLTLPFELDQPLLQLGPVGITNIEILLGLILALAAYRLWQADAPFPTLPRYWKWAGMIFILALVLSAVFAPSYKVNALKASFRTLSGLALMLSLPLLLHNRRHIRVVIQALVAGAILAALLGLFEVLTSSDLILLTPFRVRSSVIGPFLRLTGPFDYTNQAAMYLEVGTILLVALLSWSIRHMSRWGYLWLFGLAVCLEATIQTISRAAIGTLFLVFAGMTGITWLRSRDWKAALVWTAPIGLMLLLGLLAPLLSPAVILRLTGEDDSAWYRADIEVQDSLTMLADTSVVIPITIHNQGVFTWDKDRAFPVNLGATWILEDEGIELDYRPRWSFDEPVQPERTVQKSIELRAPQDSGEYTLVWDLVQEHVLWFSERQDTTAETSVTVLPNPELEPGVARPGAIPTTRATTKKQTYLPIPGRSLLWPLALRLWQQHPLTGIGLDNFRLLYGPALDMSVWNESVHSNNWYLETLVSLGLVGAVPFFLWAGSFILALVRGLLRKPDMLLVGITGGLFAFFVHGLLDYFLLFNSTALCFWGLVGMWLTYYQLDEKATS